MNKLWLLKAIDGAAPWKPWYDKCFGRVIEAADEQSARELASKDTGAETRKYPDAWTNPAYSTCEELVARGESRVILSDERWA